MADQRDVILDDASRWSFRQRARAWLASESRAPAGADQRAYSAGATRVLLMESAQLASNQTIDGFLLVRGDFSCGPGCRFQRPVYVAGNCEIGKRSALETIEVDGRLRLGPSVEVRRLAGAIGEMEMRSGSHIGGCAYSHSGIRLGLRASAGDLYAPIVSTPGGVGRAGRRRQADGRRTIEISKPGKPLHRPALRLAGIDLRKLRPLSPDTWLYDEALHLERPVLLRGHLMVQGAFSCPANSLLEGDVRASGSLTIGAGSVARKDLSAGADLVLDPGVAFQGNLRSDQMIRLSAGVRGLRAGKPVEVWSAGELVVEEDVVVRGRLRSAHQVCAVAEETAPSLGIRAAAGWR